MTRAQWSDKMKIGINAEAAENVESTETELGEASKRLMRESRAESLQVEHETPHPLFFVSVASKRLRTSVSPLFATHTSVSVSVASKGLSDDR